MPFLRRAVQGVRKTHLHLRRQTNVIQASCPPHAGFTVPNPFHPSFSNFARRSRHCTVDLHLVLMNKRGRRIRFVAASLLFFAVALAARATTIVVTNTNDSGPGSLRQALADANNGDTIVFAITGTIALTTGELLVGTSVTISATPGSMAVDGTNNSRVLHISSGTTVTISGLTIEQGN